MAFRNAGGKAGCFDPSAMLLQCPVALGPYLAPYDQECFVAPSATRRGGSLYAWNISGRPRKGRATSSLCAPAFQVRISISSAETLVAPTASSARVAGSRPPSVEAPGKITSSLMAGRKHRIRQECGVRFHAIQYHRRRIVPKGVSVDNIQGIAVSRQGRRRFSVLSPKLNLREPSFGGPDCPTRRPRHPGSSRALAWGQRPHRAPEAINRDDESPGPL